MLNKTEFKAIEPFSPDLLDSCSKLAPGQYVVEYTDSSHLTDNQWIQLMNLSLNDNVSRLNDFEAADFGFQDDSIYPSFELEVKVDGIPGTVQGSDKGQVNDVENRRVILDQLAQCFLRAGLVEPVMASETLLQIIKLQENNSLFLIPDTNAIANGTTHWLLRAFSSVNINLIPVTVSLVQLQEHDTRLKSFANKHKLANLKPALRSRSLVNHSFALFEFFEGNYQVLEVPPELLRYVKQGASTDRDYTDVLEDRLLIEAIHQVLRATRSKSPKIVVTSDVTLCRVLHAEAIPFISLLVPNVIDGSSFDSVRFDPVAKCFTGVTLPSFLWILLQVFSQIRLRNTSDGSNLDLSLYWSSKTFYDWNKHKFNIVAETISAKEQGEDSLPISTQEMSKVLSTSKQSVLDKTEHFNGLSAPNTSFVPVIQMASFCSKGQISADSLFELLQKTYSFSKPKFDHAGEVLLQAGLVTLNNSKIKGLPLLTTLNNALAVSDLDQISSIFEIHFEPYFVLMNYLKNEGRLPEHLTDDIRALLPNLSIYAYRNLRTFYLCLGQAFTSNGFAINGTQRPEASEFIDAFNTQFGARDFLAVDELIVNLSHTLNMSPWAVKRNIENLTSADFLNNYRFDTATSTKAVYGDKVLVGGLSEIKSQHLLISSVNVGDKPVFTVVRS